MLQILDNVIRMTKGDSGVFNIDVYTPDNKIYTIKENDKVYFYLTKCDCENASYTCNCLSDGYSNIKENRNVLTKEFKNSNITINPSDTEFLKCGEYMWKCVLEKDISGELIRSTVCSGRFYLVNC